MMDTNTMTSVGECFARAVAAKDRAGLRALLAEPIDFQALTPGRHWQAGAPDVVVDEIILGRWFGPGDVIEHLFSITGGQVADCERVTYRLGVRRDGHGYTVEQHAYFTTVPAAGAGTRQIDWMRLLCAGYRPDLGLG